jgi:prophage DNA circulation protein
MSWKDNLQPATYKGVPFYVKKSEYEFGRRTELKQFPNNDAPVLQDFGGAASEFMIEAYVIASIDNEFDYFENRDNLIAAFNEIKSGTLIHPYYGSMEVYPLGRAKISEEIEEGGIARLEMKFVRVNEAVQKLVLPSGTKQAANVTKDGIPVAGQVADYNSFVDDAIEVADNDILDHFSDAFKPVRSFTDKLKNTITGPLNKINEAIFKVRGGISTLIADVTGAVTSILVSIDNIIDAPCDLAHDLIGAGRAFSQLCGVGSAGVFGGMVGGCTGILRGDVKELDGITAPETLGTTCVSNSINLANDLSEEGYGFIPNSQINNSILCVDLIKYALISSAMQVAVRTEFLDQDEMIEYANTIAEAADALLLRMGEEKDESFYDSTEEDFIDNTMMYNAVDDLKNVFVQVMYAKAATVSKKVKYGVPPSIISVLQLAYEKYEDLERENEIYSMNKQLIHHPGFIPNGQEIDILNE